MVRTNWLHLPLLASFAILATACADDDDAYGMYLPPNPGGGGTGNPTAPILAEVETDQTLNATGGDGVGIYTEYAAGGHWYVWWTCDTNKTRRGCTFDVSVRTETGKLSNVRGEALLAGDSLSPLERDGTETRVHAVTKTNVAGISFDTEPGAIISLTGFVDGFPAPGYLFFVQDGKVNGGYKGTLTVPLRLQGTRP